ncbi:MAG TPA: PQQ-binding-like beta-propeller repeat protein [Thermomicrobiales bacterium]|nr:PQQ-binding-like beta-propeller repeat protein [Thermomicrobiales bacterium]
MANRELSRRHFVAGAAGAAVVGAGALGSRVLAQDSTPEPQSQAAAATPETAAAGTPEANMIGSDRFPVRTELGPAIPPEYTDAETNWPSENGNLASTRQALGSTIGTETVGQLGEAWTFGVDISATYGALVSAPAIAGDVLFQQDAMSNVYAVNKTTGESIWTNEHNEAVPSGGPNGVGLGYGMAVYTLGGPGDVIAVKADSGEEVWRTNIKGLRHEGITMAPLVYDSTVYVSTIPGTPEKFYQGNQRGIIVALDLVDGKVLWYFDTTVDNLWGADGGNARVNSGGGLWHVPAIDENGKLYVGVGNASPYPGIPEYPAGSSRPGDNDYANAVMRIDADRAAVDWFLNIKPHDLFDLDNQLSPVLGEIDGTPVVFTSGKHGYVVAVDRETGAEIWRTAVGEHKNDDLQELPEEELVEVLPGTLGGVETPIAYAEGVVYAPVYNMASFYNAGGLDASSIDITKATGQLVALDAATGEILWDVAQPTGTLAAATVVNDIVFTGGLDGVVRGYNTADGTQVFTYQATAGLNAPFAVSGDYLYIPAGGPLIPSADTWNPAPEPAAQLIALKIGGEVQTAPEAGAATAETAPEGEAAAGAEGAIEVHTVDLAFEPKELSIAADADVTITVVNKGNLQHDFIIENTDFGTEILDGGASVELVVNLPAGTYTYYCSVPGHREAGMQGTLTVA